MKQLIFILTILVNFSAFSQLSDTENKALDKLIASKVEIEADALKSSALTTIFDASFYKLKRTPKYNENGGYHESVLMKQNGKMLRVNEAEQLIPFIRKDFKLKSQADASELKDALKLLLVSASGSEEEIVQKGNQWILVCKEWFGDKEGFIVNTEKGGKINKIEYSSKLEL